MKKIILLLFFCVKIMICAAQLPSIIEGNYVIRKADTPLKFNKTYVTKDAVLTVEAGAVLEGVQLEVEGELILLGKEEDSIKIQCNRLIIRQKITAKYCQFNNTIFELFGASEFKKCLFLRSSIDNQGNVLLASDNLFFIASTSISNGLSHFKDNIFKGGVYCAILASRNASLVVEENTFLDVSMPIVINEYGSTKTLITIKGNRFWVDKAKMPDARALFVEFNRNLDRTLIFQDNKVQNFDIAFVIEFDTERSKDDTRPAKMDIIGNEIENCNTLLTFKSNNCTFERFTFKKNNCSKFQKAFVAKADDLPKQDKTQFIPLRIEKNKYDITLSELLKRIDDFTGDYEQRVQFQVENY